MLAGRGCFGDDRAEGREMSRKHPEESGEAMMRAESPVETLRKR
jgi:hypothetical protein